MTVQVGQHAGGQLPELVVGDRGVGVVGVQEAAGVPEVSRPSFEVDRVAGFGVLDSDLAGEPRAAGDDVAVLAVQEHRVLVVRASHVDVARLAVQAEQGGGAVGLEPNARRAVRVPGGDPGRGHVQVGEVAVGGVQVDLVGGPGHRDVEAAGGQRVEAGRDRV